MRHLKCYILAGFLVLGSLSTGIASLYDAVIRPLLVLTKGATKQLITQFLQKELARLIKPEQDRLIQAFQQFVAVEGHLVCLRAHKGQYLSAGLGSQVLFANRKKCSYWEYFKMINGKSTLNHGDKVRILTYRNRYWSAQRLGTLMCNRSSAQAWEIFTIKKVRGTGQIKNGDNITLFSHHQRYISAEHGGGSYVVANRASAQGWEQFAIGLAKK